jgi:hypothetical protein
MIALVAKIDKAIALAEECGTYEAAFKLEDGLAAIATVNLEELKLKARYVDADCIVGLDKQIGPLPVSIIHDLLALGHKPKASVPKEAKEDRDARHSSPHPRAVLGLAA